MASRFIRRGTSWWPPFLAGTAAGLLASVLVRRDRGAARDHGPGTLDRLAGALDEAMEGVSGGISSARSWVRGREEADPDRLQVRLEQLPCGDDCRVRSLGDGIVEVVGTCGSEEMARELIGAVSAEPGVEVVVNRVWTPSSSAPADPLG